MSSRESSSDLFRQRLKAVGYDGPIDQTALQDLFKDDETVAFMEEVLILLTPDCVLTAEELTKFKDLEKEGHVLHSETLQKGLASARHRNAVALFPDEDRQEVEFLSEYSELVRRRVQLLEAQRDQLSHHLSSVKEKSGQLSPAIENAKQERDEALQKAREDNALINQAVGDLQKSAHEIVDLHTIIPSTNGKDQPCHFLAHQDLSDHETLESKYMEALTGYTKKQFFDGVAKLTGHEEGSRYELLDVSDTDSLLVKGESETVKAGYSRELARLQSVYALSHSQRVDALAAQAKVNAACQCLDDQIQSVDVETSKDTETLQRELKESQQKLAELKEETSHVMDTELPSLLDELAALQATPVLRGDYQLKLARQNYFTSKQDKVIHYLLQQRGRHEFISMALEREGRQLRDSHRLLSAAEAQLKTAVEITEATNLAMSHPSLKDPDPTRATLDSRDGFTNCLFSMLEPETLDDSKRQQLFRTYEQMQDNIHKLQRQFDDIKTRAVARELMEEVHLAQLEQSVQQCFAVALPNSQTQNVSESLTKLSEVLGSLEKSIKDIIRDWNEKKKMVSNDPLLSAERELWVHFYTNTSRLSQIIAELGTRVQAHQQGQ